MTQRKLTFAVMGTGNSGQTFAADLALKGYPVNLAELPDFAQNLKAIEKQGGIEISGDAGNGFARMNMITPRMVSIAGVKTPPKVPNLFLSVCVELSVSAIK